MPDWPYRDVLSQAILELQEQGVLTKMKTKWWKEKRGGGACSVSCRSNLLRPHTPPPTFSGTVYSVCACVCGCSGCRRRGRRTGAGDKQSGRRLLGAGRGRRLWRVRFAAGDAAGRQGAQQGEQGRLRQLYPERNPQARLLL